MKKYPPNIQAQIARYDSFDDYRQEMRRRRHLKPSKLSYEALAMILARHPRPTQIEIAREVGLSQVQVSRLIRKYGL